MSQDEFDRRIADISRQLSTLRAVKAGRLRLRSVRVGAYRVRAHTRMIAGPA